MQKKTLSKNVKRSVDHAIDDKRRIDHSAEVITRDKLVPFFEDIKDLIVSTAKGTEHVLRKEIQRVEGELHQTQLALRCVHDGLRAEIKETELRLGGRIGAVELKLDEVNTHLSDKIDTVLVRQDDHESRITALENQRP